MIIKLEIPQINKSLVLYIAMTIFVPLVLILPSFIAGYTLADRDTPQENTNENQTEDILYLTQPIASFKGRVVEIDSNMIILENNFKKQITDIDKTATEENSGQKRIQLKFQITEDTKITKPQANIPYLITPQSTDNDGELLTIGDIEVGMIVDAISSQDLRIEQEIYTLASINLPRDKNSITGTITEIGSDYFKLEAAKPSQDTLSFEQRVGEEQIEYLIKITDHTEISQFSSKNGSIEEYQVSDLDRNMIVTVYTDTSIGDSQEVEAFYIQPSVAIEK